MVGGTLLLISGLWMGFLNPYLFEKGWYVTSLTLYLIALGLGPAMLSPKSKPVKKLLNEHQGDDIPSVYYTLSRKLFSMNDWKIYCFNYYCANDFEAILIACHEQYKRKVGTSPYGCPRCLCFKEFFQCARLC